MSESFKILSLNVNTYHNASKTQIAKRIKAVNPDIVCLQEDDLTGIFDDYVLTAKCQTEEDIANTIYFKVDAPSTSTQSKILQLPYDRCASFANFKGIRISNIHLTGGRFDDLEFLLLKNVKDSQLASVIQQKPDIIVGDFNGNNEPEPINYMSLDHEERKLFEIYWTAGHQYLIDHGYTRAVLHNDKGICKTSIFGSCVDHIYYKEDMVKMIEGGIETFSPLFTDHNAVTMTFIKSRN